MIQIAITNEQTTLEIDEQRLRDAVRLILEDAHVRRAEVSLAVVDDDTIARLNEGYLEHEGPTDVLSFLLDREDDFLEGEVVIGGPQAVREAKIYGWSPESELLLYAIHGTLHLVGYDDATEEDRTLMRERERKYLAKFDIKPRFDEIDEGGNES